MQPTKTSYAVVEALEKFAPTISRPEMTSKLEADMDRIAEGGIPEDEVLSESREMLGSMFADLEKNREDITELLRAGLREDKIIGTCSTCQSKLMIMRSKRGSRFIGCDGYPDCNFALPLPRSGQIVVTDKSCEDHGLYHIRIINSGKRPWNLGCPQCNFEEWKKTQEEEKKKNNEDRVKPKHITDIAGIGKVTAEKLAEAGIKTVDGLIAADAFELSKTTTLSVKKIKGWQDIIS